MILGISDCGHWYWRLAFAGALIAAGPPPLRPWPFPPGPDEATSLASKRSVKKKSAYHHGDLRAVLIQATQKLLLRHEPAQVTVAHACKLAGVSAAAPYRHFRNRDALIEAVILDGMMRMGQQMQQAVDGKTRGSNEAVAAIGRAYLQFAGTEPNLFRMIFQRDDDPDRSARLQAAGDNTYGVLLHEVAHRVGASPDDPTVLELALPLWAFVHGTAFLMIDDHLKMTRQKNGIDDILDRVSRQLLQDVPVAAARRPTANR